MKKIIVLMLGLSVLMPLCEGAPVPTTRAEAAEKPTAPKPPMQTNTSGTCTTITGHFVSTNYQGSPAYVLPDFSVNNAKGPMAIHGGSAMMVTNWNLYGFTVGYIHSGNAMYTMNYSQYISYPYSLWMVPASDTSSQGNPNWGYSYACDQNSLVRVNSIPPITNTGQTCVFVSYGAIQANQLTEFSVNQGVVNNIMVESLPQNPPGSVTYMEVYANAYGWVIGWIGHDTISYIPLIYAGHFYAPAVDQHGGYALIEVNHGLSYPFTCPSGMFP